VVRAALFGVGTGLAVVGLSCSPFPLLGRVPREKPRWGSWRSCPRCGPDARPLLVGLLAAALEQSTSGALALREENFLMGDRGGIEVRRGNLLGGLGHEADKATRSGTSTVAVESLRAWSSSASPAPGRGPATYSSSSSSIRRSARRSAFGSAPERRRASAASSTAATGSATVCSGSAAFRCTPLRSTAFPAPSTR